jgi:formylglycine-generating enzyme required for sulfatase activity
VTPATGRLLLGTVAFAATLLGAAVGQHQAQATPAKPAVPLLCEAYAGLPPAGPQGGMVRLPAGRFTMGSDQHYAEEMEPHEVQLKGFWIDRHDVTNAQFARFVAATGYRTLAERGRDGEADASLPAAMRVPGSAVFVRGADGQAGRWRFVPGAHWRQPEGPGSHLEGRANHPVVHIAYEDALAYARWLGRDLPTEAQWEYAARGGLEGAPYAWGASFTPGGRHQANTWQGEFPRRQAVEDGFAGTSPVGCFAANGWGLYDMVGNVWQWTATWYRPGHPDTPQRDPQGPSQRDSLDPGQPGVPARVIKGGSHLCAPNYCMRYRPAARQPREPGFGTSHLGFRTVLNRAD